MPDVMLHEAMAAVLRGRGWMHRDDLAREIAERKLYRRPQDGRFPRGFQLAVRARRFPEWFEAREGCASEIRLVPAGPGEVLGRGRRRPRRRATDRSHGFGPHLPAPLSEVEAKRLQRRRAQAARDFRPARVRTLLVAETPPAAAERYFYFEDRRGRDLLFRSVCEVVLGETPGPRDKRWALGSLRERGFFLLDLRPDPTDPRPLEDHVPGLVERVRELRPERVVLVKVTVHEAAFRPLRDAGAPVVDVRIPFPVPGQQRRFAAAFGRALKLPLPARL